MAKKLSNEQQARLWICRDCNHHLPIEKCGRCERVADVKRVEWLLNFEDAIKRDFETPTLTLHLPIAIRPTAAADGYVITDADEVEHFFYQTDSGKLDYDGECRPICITFAEKKRKANTHAIKAGK